jgi:hypothetical protein
MDMNAKQVMEGHLNEEGPKDAKDVVETVN